MMIHSHRVDDDMRRPVVHLQPNVIARLMGIDDVVPVPTPPPPKPVASGIAQFQAQRRRPPYYGGNDDDAECSGSRICLHKMMMALPRRSRSRSSSCPCRRQRHPQEEEEEQERILNMSQASKALALETSGARLSDSDSDSDGGGRTSSLLLRAIAQEDLRRQRMARRYGLGFGLGRHSSLTHHPLIKNNRNNGSVAQGEGHSSSEHEHAAAGQDQDLPSHGGHTTIVLLKPAANSNTCSESGGMSVLLGLPELHRDANMTVLLHEVRNRVQTELTLTAATAAFTGASELIKKQTKAAASAWASRPPLQQVTKEEEDRGSKRRLLRSHSFRAFRRYRKRNASPETRILKRQTPVSPLEKQANEQDASLSVLPAGVPDGQSFRSECLTTTKHCRDDDDAAASPSRLLFRSLSAPESGFALSLGRLFSFKQQHQASDEPAAAVRMASVVSAAGFSSFIRGTVSSLRRHGFSSRRKLIMFRRKTHWSWSNKTASLGAGEIHPAKMDMPICAATTPPHQTFNLFKVAQANLSELPPSPVSPLQVAAGHSSHHFVTDLHFTLPPELSPKCLSEFEAPATAAASESSFRTDMITAVEAAWSRDKAYITELLIAAGLYDDDDGPSLDHNKQANTRVDSMVRPMPICDDVFEDVEDMYYYRGDYIVGGMDGDGTDHRMLFDLANEALQSLVVVHSSSSRGAASSLRQWVLDSTGVARGKKLVDDVWHKVQAVRTNLQAQEMQTIEGMVAYEARRSVWTEVLYEDVYIVGRKIERAIFDELIQDILA